MGIIGDVHWVGVVHPTGNESSQLPGKLGNIFKSLYIPKFENNHI